MEYKHFKKLLGYIPVIILFIGAIILAFNSINFWGWFLFACLSLSLEKDKEEVTNGIN